MEEIDSENKDDKKLLSCLLNVESRLIRLLLLVTKTRSDNYIGFSLIGSKKTDDENPDTVFNTSH